MMEMEMVLPHSHEIKQAARGGKVEKINGRSPVE
jgi:hypothetical protein